MDDMTTEEIKRYYPNAPQGWQPFDESFGGGIAPDNDNGSYNVTFYGGNANGEVVQYSAVRMDPTDWLWNSCYKLGRVNGGFAYVFEQRLWDEETDLEEAKIEAAEAPEINRQILAQQGRTPRVQQQAQRPMSKQDIINHLLNG